MYSFKMRTTVTQEKNAVFNKFWGFVSENVGTITNVCVLLKVGFCLGAV